MISRKLQECRTRIESLESNLRVYRNALADERFDYGPAFNRVSEQLDAAYKDLSDIERELNVKMEGLR